MATTHIYIERDGEELEVTVEYTAYPAARAPHRRGEQYPDGFDAEAEVEIMSTKVAGVEIELTTAETEKAKEAAFEHASEHSDPDDEDAAYADSRADDAYARSI